MKPIAVLVLMLGCAESPIELPWEAPVLTDALINAISGARFGDKEFFSGHAVTCYGLAVHATASEPTQRGVQVLR